MYVERRSVNDLPKGAKILNDDEVMNYYNNHIFGTTHTQDVWYLKHGFVIAGCVSFFSNFSLVNYYRRRCKITGLVPAIFMNFGLVALPSGFALIFHFTEVRRRILLANLCTNCLYGRAAVVQNLFGMLYPLGPSAVACFIYAGLCNTYPVPGFGATKEIKESFELWKKFNKRRIPVIWLLFLANTTIITFVTRKELENKECLDETLKKQHEKLNVVAAQYQENK